MDIIKEIEKILKDVCNREIAITEQTDLYEEKILDSLDSMVFFMQLEEKFKIHIPEDADLKAENFYKVAKLISIIENGK